jgi:uncharacterized tellurite resistance protein B-like protein
MKRRRITVGICDGCGTRAPNLAAVTMTLRLCQGDAIGIATEKKTLRVIVEDPFKIKPDPCDLVLCTETRAALARMTDAYNRIDALAREKGATADDIARALTELTS